jgi:hypothetical protein
MSVLSEHCQPSLVVLVRKTTRPTDMESKRIACHARMRCMPADNKNEYLDRNAPPAKMRCRIVGFVGKGCREDDFCQQLSL